MMPDNHEQGFAPCGNSPLTELLGRAVVLDTAGPVVYVGTLRSVGPEGFWLDDADVHNCDEGHAPKEQYVLESKVHGVRVNRQRVFVLRNAVMSVSALDAAVAD
ncbi:MAG: hypothetical protein ACPMAQ_18195 [Phycisphaerae bacterium]